jgi:Fe/S biogenesis protein NfuA
MPIDDTILTISDEALETILEIRSREPDAAELALRLAVSGVRGLEFSYELTFVPAADAADDDALSTHGDLSVLIPASSIDSVHGATLHAGPAGLAIDNPNSPIPTIEPGSEAATGTIAERVAAVLEQQINPAIAMHGGFAQLDSVRDGTVFLRLGGGCQGCGLATVTLRQGIERALRAAVPDITDIVDVTDHSAGANPYYDPGMAEGHRH